MIISGALFTTPTVALEIILCLPPLDLYCRGMAGGIGSCPFATRLWRGSVIGHSSIMEKFEAVGDIDCMIPRYDFSMKFRTSIPDKEECRNGTAHLVKGTVQIFTDGSKLGGTIAVAEFIRLPDYCIVFQAEISGLWAPM